MKRVRGFTSLLLSIVLVVSFVPFGSAQAEEASADESATIASVDEPAALETDSTSADDVVLTPQSSTATVPVHGLNRQSMAYEVFTYVNNERAKNGLSALTWDGNLENVAKLRAAQIAVYYSHALPTAASTDTKSCFTIFPNVNASYRAENIADGQTSAYMVMYDASYGWMNSEGHRKNILNGNLNSIGIACFESNGCYYWVQDFSSDSGNNSKTNDNNAATWYVPALTDYINVRASASTLSLSVGDVYRFGITDTNDGDAFSKNIKIYNVNATCGSYADLLTSSHLSWNSSNTSVATVTTGSSDQEAYINAKAAGTTTITCWIPGYTGSKATIAVTVSKFTIASVTTPNAQTWTGSAITPNITVTGSDGKTLTKDTDYTVTYTNNVNVGTASATVTGIGSYSGTTTVYFTIGGVSLGNCTVSSVASKTYNGKPQTQSFTVSVGGKTLIENTDYTLSYSNNVNAGTATVRIQGKGSYSGYRDIPFTINQASIGLAQIGSIADLTYTGGAITPTFTATYNGMTLARGTDYTVAYTNNTAVGTATITLTGMGNYRYTNIATFRIVEPTKETLVAANASVGSPTYTGSAIIPSFTIKNAALMPLTPGTDYTYVVSNNVNAGIGTGKVLITGKGSYQGSYYLSFTIRPRAITDAIIADTNTIHRETYTGHAIEYKPTLTFNGSALVENRDYTLSYVDNVNPGSAKITINGIGNFTGTTWLNFIIDAASTPATWTRLPGTNRVDTMRRIVETGFNSTPSGSVILTTAYNYADALSASGLAGVLGCPVITTDGGSLSGAAADEIVRLKASKVYILGGTASVSADVEQAVWQLANVSSVKRISGPTRQETGIGIFEIGAKVGQGWSDTCVITKGYNYADALSIAPYAYAARCPVFLADSDGTVSSAVHTAVYAGGFKKVIVLGGTSGEGAIQDSSFRGMGVQVLRLAGVNRIATSVAIARWATGNDISAVFQPSVTLTYENMAVANAWGYPDSLASVSLLGPNRSVLVLVDSSEMSRSTIAGLSGKGISHGYIVGGTASVGEEVESWLESMA